MINFAEAVPNHRLPIHKLDKLKSYITGLSKTRQLHIRDAAVTIETDRRGNPIREQPSDPAWAVQLEQPRHYIDAITKWVESNNTTYGSLFRKTVNFLMPGSFHVSQRQPQLLPEQQFHTNSEHLPGENVPTAPRSRRLFDALNPSSRLRLSSRERQASAVERDLIRQTQPGFDRYIQGLGLPCANDRATTLSPETEQENTVGRSTSEFSREPDTRYSGAQFTQYKEHTHTSTTTTMGDAQDLERTAAAVMEQAHQHSNRRQEEQSTVLNPGIHNQLFPPTANTNRYGHSYGAYNTTNPGPNPFNFSNPGGGTTRPNPFSPHGTPHIPSTRLPGLPPGPPPGPTNPPTGTSEIVRISTFIAALMAGALTVMDKMSTALDTSAAVSG